MEELTKVAIDVADTRPAMLLGLPLELLVAFVVVAAEAMILGGFRYGALMIPVWYGLVHLVRRDFNRPRVLLLWFRGAAWDFHAATYGGVSVPILPPQHSEFRGILRV